MTYVGYRLIQVGGHRGGSVLRGWAKVDDEDYAEVAQFKWSIHTKGYVCRKAWVGDRKLTIYLHRLILGLEFGSEWETDHINRDKFDNRRSNLRMATRLENCQNVPALRTGRSGRRGVAWHGQRQKWAARAMINGTEHRLGLYVDIEEAARVAREFRLAYMPGAVD